MCVVNSLFVTEYIRDGRQPSIPLTVWASKFLTEIESLFGPRDRSFTLVGIDIERTPENPPIIWFPNSGIAPDDAGKKYKHIVIRLNENALKNADIARWQLAHECFHLLDPWCLEIEDRPTNWLEEGLATWYQNYRVPEAECHHELYAIAEKLVEPLMPELAEAVKRIREDRKIRIGEMNGEMLCAYCPRVESDIARRLCERFG